MSIPASGTLKRSAGIISSIAKHVRMMNLRAVKRVNIKFDPFHEKSASIRLVKIAWKFIFHFHRACVCGVAIRRV